MILLSRYTAIWCLTTYWARRTDVKEDEDRKVRTVRQNQITRYYKNRGRESSCHSGLYLKARTTFGHPTESLSAEPIGQGIKITAGTKTTASSSGKQYECRNIFWNTCCSQPTAMQFHKETKTSYIYSKFPTTSNANTTELRHLLCVQMPTLGTVRIVLGNTEALWQDGQRHTAQHISR